MEKKELRNIIRDRKRQFSKQELGELSLAVLERLRQNAMFQSASRLLLYYSLPDEVDTHCLIDQLVDEGKQVYLPVVIDSEHMQIREYTGKQDLQEGSYHIMEPIGTLLPEDRYGELQVGVIPGMSFDPEGNRLGRGKGYYDRILTLTPHLYKIGMCFDFQKVAHVPTEATDIKMDAIV